MNPFDNFFCSFYPKIRVKTMLNDIPVTISASAGLGVGGALRRGQPKTEAERLASHQSRYDSSSLPEKGTGLTRRIGS